MPEASQEKESILNLYERLDATSMDEFARVRAKADLARAEFVVELVARAASALGDLVRARIVRPIRRVLRA